MKVCGLIFFIVASIVGAGFASGKEIARYFCRFGYLAIPSAVATGIVMFVLIKQCLYIGKYAGNFKLKKPYKMLLYSTLAFLSGSTLAGNKVIGQMLSIPHFLAINLAIAGVFLLMGVKGIKKLNFIVSPMLFVSFVVLILFGLNQFGTSINFQTINSPVLSFVNVAGYISFNFLTVAMFLISVGKNYTSKQIKTASAISAAIITILILLISFTIMFSKTDIFSSIMPLITFAFNESRVLGYIMVVTVWLGLLTTLLSCIYSMLNISKDVIENKLLNVLVNLLLVFVVSCLGFNVIVNYVYFITGIVGLIFIYKIIRTKVQIKNP